MSSKNTSIIVASWLIEYFRSGNFGIPVLNSRYLNPENYLANYVRNCKVYYREVLVNKINVVRNYYDKFSPSYDDLHLGVTFMDTRQLVFGVLV